MADLPSDPLIAAWVALARGSTGLVAAVQAEVKAAGYPPLEWYDVLWELERGPEEGRRPFELEGRLLLAQYNLSRLIDRLCRAGYVEKLRCPGDGRGLMLRITAEGKAFRKRIWPTYEAAIQRHIGAHLSEAEARNLSLLLARLIDGLRAEPESTAAAEPAQAAEV